MSESSGGRIAEQGVTRRWSAADLITAARLPLAAAFVVVPSDSGRLGILAAAALSDLIDGRLARRLGSSVLGSILDPIADKVFVACAFAVVAMSGRLEAAEIVAVLLRDIVAALAFSYTTLAGTPRAIPARLSGKAVTLAQLLTLVAFLLDSDVLRPMAWATAGIGVYAIWDYAKAAPVQSRPIG